MTEELSVWQLIVNASLFVQTIMLILVAASVVSWFMIVRRAMEFNQLSLAQKRFEEEFWSGIDLAKLYKEGSSRNKGGANAVGMESIFRAGFKEYSRLSQKSGSSVAVLDGAQRAMRVALSREEEGMETHLSFLATVGSTSPYVGLLGTVWGIMAAFQSLANVQQATLAAVAPGISEALVATAMGLIAAIPAVVAYNRFSTTVDMLGNKYATFADEFSSILHRQIHNK